MQEKKAESKGDTVAIALAENGNDLLYRYLSREQFERRFGYYHPDPLIDEFSYGEGGGFSAFLWNNINVGSRIFFHTFVGGTRYLTAMYHVMDFAPAGVWRLDDKMKSRYENTHLHPDIFKQWWGGEYDPSNDMKIKEAYDSGIIYTDQDVVLLGDPRKSYDIRKTPIVLDKYLLSRLDLNGKPIKWDIVDNKGNRFDENRCITTCLRPPRVLSKSDGDMLELLVKQRHERLTSNTLFNNFLPMNSFVATKIHFECRTESEIEDIVIKNIDFLEKGLRYINRQVILDDGNRVDILACNRNGTPVIIEVKKGTADDSTLTQLASYLHQYKKQLPSSEPIGKIVCANASYKLKTACEHLGIKIHFYGEILNFEKDK